MKLCIMPDCALKVIARGLCRKHYTQAHRNGNLEEFKRGETVPRFCSFEGCDRKHKSHGICQSHYNQLYRGEELRPLRVPVKDCGFTGCDRPHNSRGYCITHAKQDKAGEPLHPIGERVRPLCSYPECGRIHASKGYCLGHYKMYRAGEELRPVPIRVFRTGCDMTGCKNPHYSKGLCNKHYQRTQNEKKRAYVHNRRNRLKTSGTMPRAAWKALLQIFGDQCMRPGCEAREELQLDHIYPVAEGGPNTFANAQILCATCNRKKGNRESIDYRPSLLSEALRERLRAVVAA